MRLPDATGPRAIQRQRLTKACERIVALDTIELTGGMPLAHPGRLEEFAKRAVLAEMNLWPPLIAVTIASVPADIGITP